ncbi:phage tail tape measure protein [Pseudonocardia sp. WMMC193]|uniref:phage tail tape measure protein n=1 Tax=Pseudonocardia sp. WMMC193 TaxID=2911965 RepID=UPI001F00DB12|nr:phage tail tape measure protein [Pseudonocardia sp. WMMC193]MCF7548168.1 phage tail tape measure protein [Pseudonocardia sp. WMMC193]
MAAGGAVEIEVVPDLAKFPGRLQSGLQATTGIASAAGRAIGLAITAGTVAAAAGFTQIIKLGNEYQGKLNELQAVSGATGSKMAEVGTRAKELGSDLTLSGVSAADAAGAMLELAKGGLTVDQAMQAAKGTLQLAGAAQLDGARAAEIQAQTLNQFALSADQAGRVADTLANTANAASGGVEDIALAMKYVGPVAASMSVSLEDTATAVGLLANNGIMADTAGTSLRGMLVSLAAPSKQAKGAIDELGITAFDSQGKFVGRVQPVDATPGCGSERSCSSKTSAGVFHPRTLRGRLFSA